MNDTLSEAALIAVKVTGNPERGSDRSGCARVRCPIPLGNRGEENARSMRRRLQSLPSSCKLSLPFATVLEVTCWSSIPSGVSGLPVLKPEPSGCAVANLLVGLTRTFA
jgi:hypothetical protein